MDERKLRMERGEAPGREARQRARAVPERLRDQQPVAVGADHREAASRLGVTGPAAVAEPVQGFAADPEAAVAVSAMPSTPRAFDRSRRRQPTGAAALEHEHGPRVVQDEEPARGPRSQIEEVLVRESLVGSEGDEGPVAQPLESLLRAHPQRAFAVLRQREDPPLAPRDLGVRIEAAPEPAIELPLAGPDPQHALAVLEQGRHVVVGQAVARRERREAVTLLAGESPAGSRPERALAIHEQDVGDERAQAVGRRVAPGRRTQREDPAVGRHPERPLGVDHEIVHLARQSRLAVGRMPREALRLEPPHARASGSHPERAFRARGDRVDERVLQALLLVQEGEPAAGVARHAADETRPDGAVRRLEQVPREAVLPQARRALVECGEADAVEAHQSELGPEPDVAVARLPDREHRSLGQPVLRAPALVGVLADRAPRIERRRARRTEAEQQTRTQQAWGAPARAASAAAAQRASHPAVRVIAWYFLGGNGSRPPSAVSRASRPPSGREVRSASA